MTEHQDKRTWQARFIDGEQRWILRVNTHDATLILLFDVLELSEDEQGEYIEEAYACETPADVAAMVQRLLEQQETQAAARVAFSVGRSKDAQAPVEIIEAIDGFRVYWKKPDQRRRAKSRFETRDEAESFAESLFRQEQVRNAKL